MKRLMCPVFSIGFYILYFMILQVITYFLPETVITAVFVLLSVFLIIPIIASKSSSRVIRAINGFGCSF
ncbi:MAG: hypothetical protein L0I88_02255 [Alkalibacterium sp.]|uniref:Uncharacterized protein n=1 Tax=Alkalibacterium gilvum TaxID=1130080 RepID=A0A1H6T1C9_9LACT|nr:hypothetical protein [Alkalibacterium gilvum]MDN6193842.1 hypothetical protein [Alkalibacterium sp.]MDN6730166.1 hypothetical protein [Alkalibacterium sp.]SEI73861.1 hypothetical protein SAMN04488113_11525 [Alkalibacterium gilvum]